MLLGFADVRPERPDAHCHGGTTFNRMALASTCGPLPMNLLRPQRQQTWCLLHGCLVWWIGDVLLLGQLIKLNIHPQPKESIPRSRVSSLGLCFPKS